MIVACKKHNNNDHNTNHNDNNDNDNNNHNNDNINWPRTQVRHPLQANQIYAVPWDRSACGQTYSAARTLPGGLPGGTWRELIKFGSV